MRGEGARHGASAPRGHGLELQAGTEPPTETSPPVKKTDISAPPPAPRTSTTTTAGSPDLAASLASSRHELSRASNRATAPSTDSMPMTAIPPTLIPAPTHV